jgi:glutathione synthase
MDPAESMAHDKDTSFAFMRAAKRRGHQSLHAAMSDLWLVGGDVFVSARKIEVSDGAPHVALGEPESLSVADLDAVLIRKDPPFDVAYLHLTQMLELVKARTLVVNDPSALSDANEKLYTFRFAHLMPRSMVSSNAARIRQFVSDVGGQAVLKPLDGAGGSGVVSVATGDPNLRALVDLLTHEGQQMALVQEFLPSVREGDKRVLLLDGQTLGAIRRVPQPDDIRANIHVGGRVEATELTAAERALVDEVAPQLAKEGLYFVGLDLIAERLIEINVTSPTGIQELGRLSQSNPEDRVIDWLEKRLG